MNLTTVLIVNIAFSVIAVGSILTIALCGIRIGERDGRGRPGSGRPDSLVDAPAASAA